MKNSEIKKLLSQYKEIKRKQKKKPTDNFELSEKLREIEHQYFHEAGTKLESDFKNCS